MPPIINAQGISKKYGITPLFQNISLVVAEGDRLGLIGPNGSGKSTLLQILEGRLQPDSGIVSIRKLARLSYVPQHSEFRQDETVSSFIEKAMEQADVPETDRLPLLVKTLGRAGFTDFEAAASTLSGGWRERLAIAAGLAQAPDLLLLDEPTNHLDLAGIEWLEDLLLSSEFASVVVSHDRYLLEHFANQVVELNRLYEEGLLRVKGNYSRFLQAKEEYLQAQGRRQESLANRVRSEIQWLRRGPKARRTKAKARIDSAQEMIEQLADLKARRRVSTAGIDFSSTNRRTRQLIELDQVSYSIGDRTLFAGIDLLIGPGMRLGLVGANGSGKTTLLRLLGDEIQSTRGQIHRPDQLRIVHFDQNRELDPKISLKRALAPDGDSVVYRNRVIHVASWAARFLFPSEALNQPVGKLSGGERARVLIAQLMLQPADLLLLDEPTNDLDIPTLEILEQSLLEFRGALVLVTHDRYMIDRVSTMVLGLDGMGEAKCFADYSQWEIWEQSRGAAESPHREKARRSRSGNSKKKLSYKEARELEGMEERIIQAEQELETQRAAIEDPAVLSDATRLLAACEAIEKTEKTVDALYSRWEELEGNRAESEAE